jgi:hypothetical protein
MGAIKDGEFVDQLNDNQPLKKDSPCGIASVSDFICTVLVGKLFVGRSRVSPVGIATRLRVGRPRNRG